jgi:hypothetical protein
MINEEEDFSDDEFEEGDYGFIISPNGELKSMMFPEDLMEDPPKTIRKILKIFGITDINVVTEKTLH